MGINQVLTAMLLGAVGLSASARPALPQDLPDNPELRAQVLKTWVECNKHYFLREAQAARIAAKEAP